MRDNRHGGAPEEYRGREQAFIKHELLKAYLEKLFMIIGMSAARLGIREICYVDGFAGPWSADSENLADTSIGISLSILERCKEELGRRGKHLRLRSLYVEKDDQAFSRLEDFVTKRGLQGIDAQAFHGDFVALRDEIQRWCGTEAFVFFFLDPKGWKDVGVEILQPLLRRPQSEFLINFMYDFINRTASMRALETGIASLLGQAVEVEGLSARAREKLLVDTYCKNLKRALAVTARNSARSVRVRVLDRARERPKYHLVYLTGHPRGIVEFMQISERLDQIQKQVRASTKQSARVSKSRQNELFNESELVDPIAGHADIQEVEAYWVNYLTDGVKRVGEEEYADMLEHTGWFPGDFQRALARLIETGIARNLDAKGKRPKQPLHWKDRERLSLVEEAS